MQLLRIHSLQGCSECYCVIMPQEEEVANLEQRICCSIKKQTGGLFFILNMFQV